jgi:hypothetical protein
MSRLLLAALTWARFFKMLWATRLTIVRTKTVHLLKHPPFGEPRFQVALAQTPLKRFERLLAQEHVDDEYDEDENRTRRTSARVRSVLIAARMSRLLLAALT